MYFFEKKKGWDLTWLMRVFTISSASIPFRAIFPKIKTIKDYVFFLQKKTKLAID